MIFFMSLVNVKLFINFEIQSAFKLMEKGEIWIMINPIIQMII